VIVQRQGQSLLGFLRERISKDWRTRNQILRSNAFNRFGSKERLSNSLGQVVLTDYRLDLGEGPLMGRLLLNHAAVGLNKIKQINALQAGI
jgi:hypothetical protein